MRWLESYKLGIGHAPLSNMYESLVFFSWTIVIIYLIIERQYKNAIIGAFATPLAFLAMAYASMSPNISDRIQPLMPALKSNWLIAHVITCFFGYAAFAIGFGLSLMYIIKQKDTEDKSKLLAHFPRVRVLDELTHQMVMFGFSLSVNRNHHRGCLGQFSLGDILVLGSQRDLVFDYLVYLCNPFAMPG